LVYLTGIRQQFLAKDAILFSVQRPFIAINHFICLRNPAMHDFPKACTGATIQRLINKGYIASKEMGMDILTLCMDN
jgi:hypothetical protein